MTLCLDDCDCLLPAGIPRAALPSALAGLLARLRAEARSCGAIAEALMQAWASPVALRPAVALLAVEGDRSGLANSYHNPGHTRDVVLNWANLAMLNAGMAASGGSPVALGAQALALGLCAALAHDLLHDGVGNIIDAPPSQPGGAPRRVRIPFRLERISADYASVVMHAAGLDGELAKTVLAAIMATEPMEGLAVVEAAAALRPPAARLLALMLRDADVLASVGLTAGEHDRQSALLGVEFGADLCTPEATEVLFAQAAEDRFRSPPGALFMPQFAALRALNQLRGDDGGWLSLASAGRRLIGA